MACRNITSLAAAILLLTPLVALAQGGSEPTPPTVTFGEPGYGGTGCVDGTTRVIASPDAQAATVIMREFTLEAGGEARSLDRKVCSIAIPVEVPDGLAVAVQRLDLRGRTDLPDGAALVVSAELFFAGDVGVPVETSIEGPSNAGFVNSTNIPEAALQWSGCGADVNLRLNASGRLRSGDATAKASVTVANFYRLATKPC